MALGKLSHEKMKVAVGIPKSWAAKTGAIACVGLGLVQKTISGLCSCNCFLQSSYLEVKRSSFFILSLIEMTPFSVDFVATKKSTFKLFITFLIPL